MRRALTSVARRGYAATPTTTAKPDLSLSNGPWSFGPDKIYTGLQEHLRRRPMLDTVPADRLILPQSRYPYQVLKHTDQLIHSGFKIVKESNDLGVSTDGVWTKDNVQVFPRLGSFALKEVDLSSPCSLTPAQKKSSFVSYFTFIKDTITDAHGADAISKLPKDLQDIDLLISELDVDEDLDELVVHNPAFLPPYSKAIFYLLNYNLLVKVIPLLTQRRLPVLDFVPTNTYPDASSLRADLLSGLPYTSADQHNDPWGTVIAPTNSIFSAWATQTAMSTDDAEELLRILRVAVSHPVEDKMLKAIVAAVGARANTTLNATAPSLEEVVLFLDYYLPKIAPALARRFYDCGVYRWLHMSSLFPLPSVDST